MASGSGGSFGAESAGLGALRRLRRTCAEAAADGRVLEPTRRDFARRAAHRRAARSVTLADLAGPHGIEADGADRARRHRARSYSQQSYGAHFAEVGVDEDTGEIRLRRMLGVFTAGRILNAKTARSPGDRRHDVRGRRGADGGARGRHALRLFRQPRPRRISCAGARRHPGDRCACSCPSSTTSRTR